jgi:hypothetical protein
MPHCTLSLSCEAPKVLRNLERELVNSILKDGEPHYINWNKSLTFTC